MNNRYLSVRSLTLCTAFAAFALLAVPVCAQQNVAFTPALGNDATVPNLAAFFDDPEAIYEGARVEYNVTQNKQKGMLIHAKFRVKHGLDTACMLIAYFYYDDTNNTRLKTRDKKYQDTSGNISTHVNFTPAYDPAVYRDLQLFMPYTALNLESGERFDLKFYLALYDTEGGRFFGKSGWYKFNVNMP